MELRQILCRLLSALGLHYFLSVLVRMLGRGLTLHLARSADKQIAHSYRESVPAAASIQTSQSRWRIRQTLLADFNGGSVKSKDIN